MKTLISLTFLLTKNNGFMSFRAEYVVINGKYVIIEVSKTTDFSEMMR